MIWEETGKTCLPMVRFPFSSFPRPHLSQILKHDSTLLCCYHTVGKFLLCKKKLLVMCDQCEIKARELSGHIIPHFPPENAVFFFACDSSFSLYVEWTSHMWKMLIWFKEDEIKVLLCHLLHLRWKLSHDLRQERKNFWNAARVCKEHVFSVHRWFTSLNWKGKEAC